MFAWLPLRSAPTRFGGSEPARGTGCSLTGSFQAADTERAIPDGLDGGFWLVFFALRIRKRRWVIEEIHDRGEELAAGDRGRELKNVVGVSLWIADEHVGQHPLGARGGARIADEVCAVLALTDLAEWHIVPDDLQLVAVLVLDHVQ